MTGISTPAIRTLPGLLRGEMNQLRIWLEGAWLWRLFLHGVIITAGAGCYGAVVGIWRDPLQALYTGIKLPLILILTGVGNALINAMLAPLLGLSLSLRQSLLAVMLSFSITAMVLGGLSPLVLFLVWNLPPMESGSGGVPMSYTFLMLSQVAVIVAAGIAGNVRLVQLLRELSGKCAVARNVLFSWLGVNLLLGSQLAWILRPFFGSPHLEVQFVRPNALEGNFFETIYYSIKYILSAS